MVFPEGFSGDQIKKIEKGEKDEVWKPMGSWVNDPEEKDICMCWPEYSQLDW